MFTINFMHGYIYIIACPILLNFTVGVDCNEIQNASEKQVI